jgi:serine/threonine protein phosphatase PrpC
MRIATGVATDIGRVRERNDDSFLVESPLFAVADGMGGHRGGDVASQLALQTVDDLFRSGRGSLADDVREANRAVFQRSSADRNVAGMGTTLTAAVVEDDVAHVVHVGDSRAYLLRAGAFRQLTEDHTLVGRMVKAGEITPAEADVHPHRNVITRALGQEPDLEVDELDLGLLEGDRLLLCSDGLTNMVAEEQIQAILTSTADAQEAADRLVRAANRAGGFDNITVLVVDVVEGGGELDGAAPSTSTLRAPRHATQADPGEGATSLRRWARPLIALGIVLVVLVVGITGFRAWLDGRWYVGAANGHVAIYQGIPAQVLGFELSHVVVETNLPSADAEALKSHTGIAQGLNVDSREDAQSVVDQIRADLRRQRRNAKGVA